MSVDYTIYIYEVCWECRRKFHEVEYNQMIYKLYGKKYNKPQRSVWIQLQSRGLWQAYDKSAARVAQSGSELLLGGSVAQWLSCSVGLEWLRVGPVCGPLSPHPPLSSVATIWRLQRHLRLVFVSGDICFIFLPLFMIIFNSYFFFFVLFLPWLWQTHACWLIFLVACFLFLRRGNSRNVRDAVWSPFLAPWWLTF